jgi:hypothetical protein
MSQIERSPVRRAWDASLADNLDAVTIVAPLHAAAGPAVSELIQRVGFAIIESDPTALDDMSMDVRRAELLALSNALGRPIIQSTRKELVEDIKDFSDIDERDDRGYRSAGELKPHSDPPTLILLHCVQPARVGGESSLVSVASIVERMLGSDPDLVDELFESFPDWRVDGQYGQPGAGLSAVQRPVLARHNGTISCVIYRPFIDLAATAMFPVHPSHELGDFFTPRPA